MDKNLSTLKSGDFINGKLFLTGSKVISNKRIPFCVLVGNNRKILKYFEGEDIGDAKNKLSEYLLNNS